MIKRLVGVLLVLSIAGCVTYNSATGRKELIFVSTSQEVSMGKSYHQEFLNKEKVIVSGEEYDRLNRIGRKIALISDRQDYQYHFYLIDKDEFNAFTVPGGYVYFYTGLFRELKTDDAIAAVLAHEIGHCSAKHVIKKFQAAQGYNWARSLVLDIVNLRAPGAGSMGSLAALGADGIVSLAMTAYSRQDELEADRLGIKYLYLAHYDLNGMINVFEVLQAKAPKDRMPVFLRSHPLTKDRMTQAKKEIAEVDKKY